MNRKWIVGFLFLVLIFFQDSRGLIGLKKPVKPNRFIQKTGYDNIIQYYNNLRYHEQWDFITKLGKQKNLELLIAICDSEIEGSCKAATEVCGLLSSKQAVHFCKRFQPDSSNWVAAFHALSYHSKEDVIDYIKEMAKGEGLRRSVRCYCFRVCLNANWDDLLELAESEKYNRGLVCFINQAIDEKTIGD